MDGPDLDTQPTGVPAFDDVEATLPPPPVCLELANTQYVHRGGIHDGIDSLRGLRGWLTRMRSRLVTPLSVDDLDDVRETDVLAAYDLRAAVRSLAGAQIEGQSMDPEAAARINHRVSLIPRWNELVVTDDGPVTTRTRSTAAGVPAAIAEIAVDAVTLFGAMDLREAVAACQAPGCINLFVRDQPHRQWCSTRCGNRVQAIATGSITIP